jgi:hypothetical protein
MSHDGGANVLGKHVGETRVTSATGLITFDKDMRSKLVYSDVDKLEIKFLKVKFHTAPIFTPAITR